MPDTGRIERPGTSARGDIYIPQEIVIDRSERLRAIPGVSYRPFLSFHPPLSAFKRGCAPVATVLSNAAHLHTVSPPSPFVPTSFGGFIVVYDIQLFCTTSLPPTSRRFFSRLVSFSLVSIRRCNEHSSVYPRVGNSIDRDWVARRLPAWLKIGGNCEIFVQRIL